MRPKHLVYHVMSFFAMLTFREFCNRWEVLSRTLSSLSGSVMGWQWGQGPWKHFPYVQVSDVLCYKPIAIIFAMCLESYQRPLHSSLVRAIFFDKDLCEAKTSFLSCDELFSMCLESFHRPLHSLLFRAILFDKDLYEAKNISSTWLLSVDITGVDRSRWK